MPLMMVCPDSGSMATYDAAAGGSAVRTSVQSAERRLSRVAAGLPGRQPGSGEIKASHLEGGVLLGEAVEGLGEVGGLLPAADRHTQTRMPSVGGRMCTPRPASRDLPNAGSAVERVASGQAQRGRQAGHGLPGTGGSCLALGATARLMTGSGTEIDVMARLGGGRVGGRSLSAVRCVCEGCHVGGCLFQLKPQAWLRLVPAPAPDHPSSGAPAQRSTAAEQRQLRQPTGGTRSRGVCVAEGVARSALDAKHGHDVSRPRLGDVLQLVGVHAHQARHLGVGGGGRSVCVCKCVALVGRKRGVWCVCVCVWRAP